MKREQGRMLDRRRPGFAAAVILLSTCSVCRAASNAEEILDSFGRDTGLFVLVGCGEQSAPEVAVDLGKNGNSLVHVISRDRKESIAFQDAISKAGVKGNVSVEELPLTKLPYRNNMVNVLIVMDQAESAKLGFRLG